MNKTPPVTMKTHKDEAAMYDGAFVSNGYWMAKAGVVAFGDPALDALVAAGTPFYRGNYGEDLRTGDAAKCPEKLASGLADWQTLPTDGNALTDTTWSIETRAPDEEDPASAARIFTHPSGRFVALDTGYFDSFRWFQLFQATEYKAVSVWSGETLVAIVMPIKYDDFDKCLRRLTGRKP
jgi:hypothetical protein